ncbi:MAG: ATP-binding protein [Bacteroidetes bacterium]|nr:ATP-binding protein [Bacteroidota bacterium]
MSNDLVGYSRAGDVFHYRWAARRCLRLIYPNTPIRDIYIEGSPEILKAGEYVIDVAEYSFFQDGSKAIEYYQLKHTTVHEEDGFTLSDLKDTFTGFAKRYLQHKKDHDPLLKNFSFTVITNREIASSFKSNLSGIATGGSFTPGFKDTIESYTGLNGVDLQDFCSLIHLQDGEGNYAVQKEELRVELAQLIAGSLENAQVENLVALVQERVLPDSDGMINREDVLNRFGITSERDLYPAPAVWEKAPNLIVREQHESLNKSIDDSTVSVIVHASGGVGKSVFCRQLVNSLPEGSLGIAYDCFGAGSYRNRSEPRHRHRDALVQIANELASKGLCDPLIVQNSSLESDIMRKFLQCVRKAVESLRKTYTTAKLIILIDAADNAEMAAKEVVEACFAHELLREEMPDGCKLVMLCRTERIDLLQPNSSILKLELQPFSSEESLENLRRWFPDANERDGAEFHRLTAANPRVQANALDANFNSINDLLASLGPSVTSVETQIETQLKTAVSKITDRLPPSERLPINSICLGLASLPPHIPLEVLSEAAGVSVAEVKSFVSDIGRSLWMSDASVQFRDEPTETWFRNAYMPTPQNYSEYVKILEPLAEKTTYVAEVLPQLYLKAGQYGKLIATALSDDFLPQANHAEARNIRIYRLQFAFKAALKTNKYNDAVRLAMRAGEEVAGSQRQLGFFQANIDLLTALQSKEKVQEMAFRKSLSGAWDGSENIYSASLLSGIKEYQGEARGYLRSAINWLDIYFEERKKMGEHERHDRNEINHADILELAYAFLNISGVDGCADFIFRMRPGHFMGQVVRLLIRRLIDGGRFDDINNLLFHFIREPHYIVASVSEFVETGFFPDAKNLEIGLDLLCSRRTRIEASRNFYNDTLTPSIVSFLEACVHAGLPQAKILRALRHYVPIRASQSVNSAYSYAERSVFLRALAIRALLSGDFSIDIEVILPEAYVKQKHRERDNDITQFKEVIGGLFPWFLLRVRVIQKGNLNLISEVAPANESSLKARRSRYQNQDTLPKEIAKVCADIIVFSGMTPENEIKEFFEKFLMNDKAFMLGDKLDLLRAACRLPHLASVRQLLEQPTFEQIKSYSADGPDDIASRYIGLARAVLILSKTDANAYFEEAVKIASKFGDEIIQRWEAIVSLAAKACKNRPVADQLAYRFVRCAELVGDSVAREKHWDRGRAMRICARMSPGVAISALSRWRERNVGRFEYELEDVLIELIGSRKISPSVGWSLCRFFSYHRLNNILSLCLQNEPSLDTRKNIISDAAQLLQIEGATYWAWSEINVQAKTYGVVNDTVDRICKYYERLADSEDKPADTDNLLVTDRTSNPKWNELFQGIDLASEHGLKDLLIRNKANADKEHLRGDTHSLIGEAVKRLNEHSFLGFIEAAFATESLNFYDIRHILSSLPEAWKSKASYVASSPKIIHRLGATFAHELAAYSRYDHYVNDLNLDGPLSQKLAEGIVAGLSVGSGVGNADTFFGFVSLISNYIQEDDAADLVGYSLSRFEMRIDPNFGDGEWSSPLQPKEDMSDNIAGFVWSALGSPKSSVRWNAAHCVRMFAELKCDAEVQALMRWIKHDKVDAFGHAKYEFYNLHARQYLLMAFARISVDNANQLLPFHDSFLHYAIVEPHLLIQSFAADVVLNIEKNRPGTFTETDLGKVRNVGNTTMPIKEEDYNYSTDSPWHERNEIDGGMEFNFGWDFDKYWHEPLGDVFGIPGKQVEELATAVIRRDWNLEGMDTYDDDKRNGIWDRSEKETWHNKTDYPLVDNLSFYLSYHSMLVVAAKLIENMPIVRTGSWPDENPWAEWKSRHELSREDGKWLSDYRDALPLDRPAWIGQAKTESWQTEIKDEVFFNAIGETPCDSEWINICGNWSEKSDERTEIVTVSTALVSTETSDALLRALSTVSDPYDYKIPSYQEIDIEIESGKFNLRGWIKERSYRTGLDQLDPYAESISYAPYNIGDSFIEDLSLSVDDERKSWHEENSGEICLMSTSWLSHKEKRDEDADQSGSRLRAKLTFLKMLCKKYNCDIIFDIGVRRDISYKYDRSNREWVGPKHKIFILSANGKLRTTNESYQLG